MTTLIEAFIVNVFHSYHALGSEIEENDINYKIEYIANPEIEDDWDCQYGITKYYTDDEQSNLLCIEYHQGHEDNESEYCFTEFAYNYYKNVILTYCISKLEEYYNKNITV